MLYRKYCNRSSYYIYEIIQKPKPSNYKTYWKKNIIDKKNIYTPESESGPYLLWIRFSGVRKGHPNLHHVKPERDTTTQWQWKVSVTPERDGRREMVDVGEGRKKGELALLAIDGCTPEILRVTSLRTCRKCISENVVMFSCILDVVLFQRWEICWKRVRRWGGLCKCTGIYKINLFEFCIEILPREYFSITNNKYPSCCVIIDFAFKIWDTNKILTIR